MLNKINERKFLFLTLFLYMLFSLLKMRKYILDGRFWAEEGVFFYTDISKLDFIDSIFYIFNGHLEIFTNITVLISTIFPFKYAPLITTYISLFLQSIPIFLIIYFYKRLSFSRLGLIFFIIIYCSIPQSKEVWTNSINLHFFFSFLVFVILLLKPINNISNWIFRFLLLLSGLSGIPANFLVPAFLLSAIITKEKEKLIQFLILCCTSIIQISLIIRNSLEIGDRNISFDPLLTWLSSLSQIVYGPLLRSNYASFPRIIYGNEISFLTLIALVLVFITSFFLIKEFIKLIKIDKFNYIYIFSMFLLIFFSVLTSLGHDKSNLISADGSGRYFYASALIFYMFLIVNKESLSKLFKIFIIIICLHNILYVHKNFKGPSWTESLKDACDFNEKFIDIWPYGWKMEKPKNIKGNDCIKIN